ncbi:MAG: hypothetical protein ACJ72W_05410 [Actinoallomurus sp.]
MYRAFLIRIVDHVAASGMHRMISASIPAPGKPTRIRVGAISSAVSPAFPHGTEAVQADNALGGVVPTRQEDLATVVASWESIRTEALPVGMSRDLIRRIAEEFWTT